MNSYDQKTCAWGNYVLEVDVEIMNAGKGWSPHPSLEDAKELDDVRESLRKGDLKRAAKSARVCRLAPVSA